MFVANLQKINILVDESFWVYTVNVNCIVFYIFSIKSKHARKNRKWLWPLRGIF